MTFGQMNIRKNRIWGKFIRLKIFTIVHDFLFILKKYETLKREINRCFFICVSLCGSLDFPSSIYVVWIIIVHNVRTRYLNTPDGRFATKSSFLQGKASRATVKVPASCMYTLNLNSVYTFISAYMQGIRRGSGLIATY